MSEEAKVNEEEITRIRSRIEEVMSSILSKKYNAVIKIKFVDKEDNK
jgi:hypothetical protein